MRLSDVGTGRLSGLKDKLVCHFKLAVDMFRELMNDADRLLLERELMGLGVDGYCYIRVDNRASWPVPIYTFREHLTCFSNVKCIRFLTLELVHKVGGFTVTRAVMGCKVGVRTSE